MRYYTNDYQLSAREQCDKNLFKNLLSEEKKWCRQQFSDAIRPYEIINYIVKWKIAFVSQYLKNVLDHRAQTLHYLYKSLNNEDDALSVDSELIEYLLTECTLAAANVHYMKLKMYQVYMANHDRDSMQMDHSVRQDSSAWPYSAGWPIF